jgi:hypothetical protein
MLGGLAGIQGTRIINNQAGQQVATASYAADLLLLQLHCYCRCLCTNCQLACAECAEMLAS